jgi:hypothetical protein
MYVRESRCAEVFLFMCCCSLCSAAVGILFSGGIDCVLLTTLVARVLPAHTPLDLINVAFGPNRRDVLAPSAVATCVPASTMAAVLPDVSPEASSETVTTSSSPAVDTIAGRAAAPPCACACACHAPALMGRAGDAVAVAAAAGISDAEVEATYAAAPAVVAPVASACDVGAGGEQAWRRWFLVPDRLAAINALHELTYEH